MTALMSIHDASERTRKARIAAAVGRVTPPATDPSTIGQRFRYYVREYIAAIIEPKIKDACLNCETHVSVVLDIVTFWESSRFDQGYYTITAATNYLSAASRGMVTILPEVLRALGYVVESNIAVEYGDSLDNVSIFIKISWPA